MELIVLSIGVMALGATLIHFAVEGRKAQLMPEGAALNGRRDLLSARNDASPAATLRGQRQEFSKTDVLLAEALTELLSLKEQVDHLQTRVDALTGSKPAPSSAARPARRRISRSVA